MGLPPFYYRYRRFNPNMPFFNQTSVTGSTPADQYQKLKIIQNTVRVPSSLYIANKGPLSSYQKPLVNGTGVCWNQMSDRAVPSVQPMTVPTGYHTSMNSRHTSVTSSKPGCQTPGGIGCDVKHNSYDRYLNRLKGKGPLRRVITNQGTGIKTNIVSGCDCLPNQDQVIYYNPLYQPYPTHKYGFNVGAYVYAIETGTDFYNRALVVAKDDITDIYTIQFDDLTVQTVTNVNELLIYFPCGKC